MDERVSKLKAALPEIFEPRIPPVGDLDEEFVLIDVPPSRRDRVADDTVLDVVDQARDPSEVETELLADLDRWDEDWAKPLIDRTSDEVHDADLERLRDELVGRPRSDVFDRLRKRITGTFPGGPAGLSGARTKNFVPPPDALAFYLPFHRYPDEWGIYLVDIGVASLSRDLQAILHSRGNRTFAAHETRRIALAYLYHHEAYHCAVEAFATRSELPMRRPVYRSGLRRLFTRWVPGAPHEETLATAYGLRKVRQGFRTQNVPGRKLPGRKLDAAIQALSTYLSLCPPPYAAGVAYVDDTRFLDLELAFKEKAIASCHRNRRAVASDAWLVATYMMTPLLQRNRKYSWICDRRDFRIRSRLAVHYFSRRDVIGCLQRLANARLESGGSHLHIVREMLDNGVVRERRTQVPSGEVRDGTLSRMLKDLELDLNVHRFRQRCRDIGHSLS